MLFNFGTERCIISKLCKWRWWGGGGKLRRRGASCRFQIPIFQIKDYQNGVRDTFNFHFSLLISKKRSKNGVKTLVWMIAGQMSNVKINKVKCQMQKINKVKCQMSKINKVKCQMSKINKVNFDGAYLRSSSGHF